MILRRTERRGTLCGLLCVVVLWETRQFPLSEKIPKGFLDGLLHRILTGSLVNGSSQIPRCNDWCSYWFLQYFGLEMRLWLLVSCKAVSILPSPFWSWSVGSCLCFYFFPNFFPIEQSPQWRKQWGKKEDQASLGWDVSVLLPEVSWSLWKCF